MSSSTAKIIEVLVQPEPRRDRVTVQVVTENIETVNLSILETDLKADGPPGTFVLDVPEFVAWSPDTPTLYTLRCAAPECPNAVEVSFGMRELSLQEQRFSLNQHPLHLKAFRYVPEGDADVDATRADFTAARGAGFNAVWLPLNASTPATLDAADAVGLLATVTVDAPANDAALDTTLRSLCNHASLVMWRVKTKGTGDRVAKLDATRIVLVEPAPDTDETPCLLRPGRGEPTAYESFSMTLPAVISQEAESFLTRAGHESAVNLAHLQGLARLERDIDGDDDESFLEQLAAVQAETIQIGFGALRSNPRLAGYVVEDALRAQAPGALAHMTSRLAAFAEAHQPMRPVVSLSRTNLVPRQEIELSALLLNEERIEGRADLSLQVVGPTNQVLWKKKRNVKLPRHGRELWTGTISASGSTGPHRFIVRLMGASGRLAETSVPFFVTEPPKSWTGPIDIVDPDHRWTELCTHLAPNLDAQAPVILLPPLAPTIRAYPDNALGQWLGRIREGAVGIAFDPPADWNDLQPHLEMPIETENLSLLDGRGTVVQGRLHPVFDDLPARGPMHRPYRNVLSARALRGDGEEDIVRALRWNGDVEHGDAMLVRRFGNGRIVLTTLRLLERLHRDPVAGKLFVNLLHHSARRAIASTGIARSETRVVEWLRKERTRLSPWRIIGPFPNWDGQGMKEEYPPELEFDIAATYPGWYRAVAWRPCFQDAQDPGDIDIATLAAPETFSAAPIAGVFYAISEFFTEARYPATIALRHSGDAKLWLNGRLVFESESRPGNAHTEIEAPDVLLRQGRNTALVKIGVCRENPGFRLEISPSTRPSHRAS